MGLAEIAGTAVGTALATLAVVADSTTGWRMEIKHTRALVNAALDGRLAEAKFTADPNFGVLVPDACPGVPAEVLNPRNTWTDKAAYDAQARDLTRRFEDNFGQFESHVDDKVKAAAIKAAA